MDRTLAIGTVAFIAIMVFIHRVAMPYVVAEFGVLGVAGWIAACLGLATVLDRG